jgi:hypothetical protein
MPFSYFSYSDVYFSYLYNELVGSINELVGSQESNGNPWVVDLTAIHLSQVVRTFANVPCWRLPLCVSGYLQPVSGNVPGALLYLPSYLTVGMLYHVFVWFIASFLLSNFTICACKLTISFFISPLLLLPTFTSWISHAPFLLCWDWICLGLVIVWD